MIPEVRQAPRPHHDPEVQALADINNEELALFKRPAAYQGEGGQLKQPPTDPAKPHQAYPPEMYQALLEMTDEEVTKRLSVPEPPVRVPAADLMPAYDK